jgi:hypothetical protein
VAKGFRMFNDVDGGDPPPPESSNVISLDAARRLRDTILEPMIKRVGGQILFTFVSSPSAGSRAADTYTSLLKAGWRFGVFPEEPGTHLQTNLLEVRRDPIKALTKIVERNFRDKTATDWKVRTGGILKYIPLESLLP